MEKKIKESTNKSLKSYDFLKNSKFSDVSQNFEDIRCPLKTSNFTKQLIKVTQRRSLTQERRLSALFAPVKLRRATSLSNELNISKNIFFRSQPSLHYAYKEDNLRIEDRNPCMTQANFLPRGPADPADPEGSVGAPLKNFESTEVILTSRSSKARQKKFHRHFKQVDIDEQVLNYYSCALVGDILLQGHLYITENFFAFYSNVFGYVTKLLIPTVDVLKISKEKTAKIIPNAVGILTEDEKHVFGSLLSRDSTYKFMLQVWKAATTSTPVVTITPPSTIKTELPSEDDSSLTSGNEDGSLYVSKITTSTSSENLQKLLPKMRSGFVMAPVESKDQNRHLNSFKMTPALGISVALLAFLFASAGYLLFRIALVQNHFNDLSISTKSDVYDDILKWQSALHSLSATKIQEFLNMNLNQIVKVRLSLEALSTMMLLKNNNSEKSTLSKWAKNDIKETNDDAPKEKNLQGF